ncbi:Fe-S oxidoreductase [Halobacteriales archaeon SW_7_68_16]|nr:MAG: Fe-S oxidoreductase [Halobacteriales archaeon SW_7_68_16]
MQSGQVTRETFWGISGIGEVVFYYLAAVAILVFLYGVYDRVARYATGSEDPTDRLDDVVGRIRGAAATVGSNRSLFDRDLYAGLMHTFVLWGFLTLLVGTTILAIDIDLWRGLLGQPSFFVGDFYLAYSLVMDALGLLFVVGVGMAMYRRYGAGTDRLDGSHTGLEDHLFLGTLFALGVGGYVMEGLRILGTADVTAAGIEFVGFERVSFVGWFVADVFRLGGMGPGLAADLYWWAWWSHALIAFAFIAAIPYAKPFHMLSSFANVVTADERAGVRLPRVPEDASPEEIGPSDVEDFSWKQLLDHDACTKCGRCSSVCPANASDRPLDPQEVILDLKEYRESVDAGGERKPNVADGGTSVIDAETMNSCMSCMACMDACPVEIEHVTQFTGMNRRLTESGQMDDNVQDAMMNVFRTGNTFGDPERKRPDWAEDLPFVVPASYDERNRRIARSLATIFEAADVDYGILYEDERTDGNDVRRVGEEGLYETLVEDNSEAIGNCEFDRLVCTDPHSYNTFKNEYPEFDVCPWDGDVVYHYTQLVEDLASGGRLDVPATLDRDVTYHDPCHLGRFNGEYEAPRELVRETGCSLREMPRNRADSFCCGGGGGGLWMDLPGEKPSEERLREATEDTEGAVETFVVACPMCATMYEDGRKTGGYEDDVEIVGLTELLVEALDAEERAAP